MQKGFSHNEITPVLEEFAENIKAGKLAPVLKSEEPVANDGPLTVIVGKNFD